jgi:hypothetical protein
MDDNNEWTEVDKAIWILTYGHPSFYWVVEAEGEKIVKRPAGERVPPWMKHRKIEITNIKIKDVVLNPYGEFEIRSDQHTSKE